MSDERKFEPVVDLANQKKGPLKTVFDSFFTVDIKTFGKWLYDKKIIPTLKDLVISAITYQFYQNGSGSSESSSVGSGKYDYTKHSKYSYVQEESSSISKPKDIPDYRDLPPLSPDKASRIIREVKEAIDKWGTVSVDQFYTLFGYTSTDPIDTKWGWGKGDFDTASTRPAQRGLVYLDIPKAKSLRLR